MPSGRFILATFYWLLGDTKSSRCFRLSLPFEIGIPDKNEITLDSKIRKEDERLHNGFGDDHLYRSEGHQKLNQEIRNGARTKGQSKILRKCSDDLFPGKKDQSLDDKIIVHHRYRTSAGLPSQKIGGEAVNQDKQRVIDESRR